MSMQGAHVNDTYPHTLTSLIAPDPDGEGWVATLYRPDGPLRVADPSVRVGQHFDTYNEAEAFVENAVKQLADIHVVQHDLVSITTVYRLKEVGE